MTVKLFKIKNFQFYILKNAICLYQYFFLNDFYVKQPYDVEISFPGYLHVQLLISYANASRDAIFHFTTNVGKYQPGRAYPS